ncbi:MAG TPA: glycosyl hydrolase family 79 C-terminal domain-containing protein [Solirubrobacteraceae bacterium]|nr:glycosyl hydrolase family 79 C-terminal domain-containing protein [Solirubrobacteraceae bacterium]
MVGPAYPCASKTASRRRRRGLWLLAVAVGAFALAVFLPQYRQAQAELDDHTAPRTPDAAVTVLGAPLTGPLPSGFVGVSLEYTALRALAGLDPHAINPVLAPLIRNLAPGQRPVLRFGGNSADNTWVPVRGISRPPGIKFTLTPRRLAIMRTLTRAAHARVIVGLDLETGNVTLPVVEARALLASLGRHSVQTFEIGNEPLRYRIFAWYKTPNGQPRYARSRTYDFAAFNREFGTVARLLPPGIGVAGPTMGGIRWMNRLPQFIAGQPKLNTISHHAYPLNRCATINDAGSPTLAKLLSTTASLGLASRVASYAATARQFHLPFRLDELNSVACGGKSGISNSMASALWALDTLFAMVRTGVTGVNFHTFHKAGYALFDFHHTVGGRWLTSVKPIYYGLLMFARAAPPGSRLLDLSRTGTPYVRAWAARTRGHLTHVVLINADQSHPHLVAVQVPGAIAPGSLLRLTAPGAAATSGVQLGGRMFGRRTDGILPAPRQSRLAPGPSGRYVVRLGPASAALLTLRPTGPAAAT